jgi:hypothetical protein
MRTQIAGTDFKPFMKALVLIACAVLIILPPVFADDYSQIQGYWQCQEGGSAATLEFKSRKQLIYNGVTYSYYLAPGSIVVQEESGLVNYFFTVEGGALIVFSPDGSLIWCQKAQKHKVAEMPEKAGQPPLQRPYEQQIDQAWPPSYAKPQGKINEENPSAEALLYKFAGRWDHMTRNTLTNLFLKPDGTYEEVYESGYSGVFTDQGGHQSGHWGAAGAQQACGHWKVAGSLRQGKLYLEDQNGRQLVCDYQVHIKRNEVFWGEYFFNGKLYSVKYIYR